MRSHFTLGLPVREQHRIEHLHGASASAAEVPSSPNAVVPVAAMVEDIVESAAGVGAGGVVAGSESAVASLRTGSNVGVVGLAAAASSSDLPVGSESIPRVALAEKRQLADGLLAVQQGACCFTTLSTQSAVE